MNSSQIVNLFKNATRITKYGETSRHLFAEWLKIPAKSRFMVFDTETTGVIFDEPTILLHDNKEIQCPGPVIFGMSLALELGDQIVLVWARIDTKLYAEICKLLNKPSIKAAHNARYDIRMVEGEDIKVKGRVDCTYTMARIVYDRRRKHALQKLVELWCPELSDWEVEVKAEMRKLRASYTRSGHPKDYVNYSFIPDKLMCPYSMMDSFMTLIGYRILWPTIKRDFPELYEREKKIYYIVSKIEQRGLAFDYKKAYRKAKRLQSLATAEKDKMARITKNKTFNSNSPKQVLNALHEMQVRDKDLTYKGKVTTGADILRELQVKTKRPKVVRFIDSLLLHRAYVKTVNTYLLPLAKRAEINNGIIRASINPADTRTGRMAARNPNLQNIPTLNPRRGRTSGGINPVRSCFICRDGFANYYFDYSQMEIVLFGAHTDTRIILDTYNSGNDVHGAMATELYDKDYDKTQRDRTKDTNYGIIYGMGIMGMAKYRACTLKQAREFLDFYYETFDTIHAFQDECKQRLELDGYVEDWFGKRYHIPANEAYKAVNAIIQGGCAQIFKMALLNLTEFLADGEHILLPLHDEFQIEREGDARPNEKTFTAAVVSCMTDIEQLIERELELRVDVSKSITNWAEKEKVDI